MRKSLFFLAAVIFLSLSLLSQPPYTTDYYFNLFDFKGKPITHADLTTGLVSLYVPQSARPQLFVNAHTDKENKQYRNQLYLRLHTVTLTTDWLFVTSNDTMLLQLPSSALDVYLDSLNIVSGNYEALLTKVNAGGKFEGIPRQKNCNLDLTGNSWYKAYFDIWCVANKQMPMYKEKPKTNSLEKTNFGNTLLQYQKLKLCQTIVEEPRIIKLLSPLNKNEKFRLLNNADTAFISITLSEDMGIVYRSNYFLKEGLPDGRYDTFVDDTLEFTGHFKDGKKDNLWIAYYRNGQIRSLTPYIFGQQDGNEIGFYQSGRVFYLTIYANHCLQEGIQYYENGNVMYKMFYRDCKYVRRETYDTNGKLRSYD